MSGNRADRPRREWSAEQVSQAVIFAVVGLGALITSAISYEHEYVLARHNGQVRWVSSLLPFSVDGMILVSGVALMWAAMHAVRGWDRLWQPRCVLAVGIAATIAANFFSDLRLRWLGPAVSASSGVALVLMSAVAFWLLAEQRKVARGETSQRDVNCSCPAPATSLDEALPLARARLQELGQPCGEELLADRFGVSRHRVRAILKPQPSEPSLNGDGAP